MQRIKAEVECKGSGSGNGMPDLPRDALLGSKHVHRTDSKTCRVVSAFFAKECFFRISELHSIVRKLCIRRLGHRVTVFVNYIYRVFHSGKQSKFPIWRGLDLDE